MTSFVRRVGETLITAYQFALNSPSLRIIQKSVDNLTRRAAYKLKARQLAAALDLLTEEIINSDKYFLCLSEKDRIEVARQYHEELNQPLAYIEEYPIQANEKGKYIFKVFSLIENKLICGSATFFICNSVKILSLLHHRDIVKIALAYSQEGNNSDSKLLNIESKHKKG